MDAICLPNGNLVVPRRVESEDGQTVGDGFEEIGPDHPEYESWLPSSRPPRPDMTLIEEGRSRGLEGDALAQFVADAFALPSLEDAWEHILLADGDPRGEDVRDPDWNRRFMPTCATGGDGEEDVVREVRLELDLPDEHAARAWIEEWSR